LKDNLSVALALRRNDQAKAIRVSKTEHPRSPSIRGFGIQDGSGVLRAVGDGVHVLRRRELEREPRALRAIFSLGAIVLREQNPRRAGAHGRREEAAVPLELSIDREAEHVAVPIATSPDARDGQRRLEALRRQGCLPPLGLRRLLIHDLHNKANGRVGPS